MPQTNFLRLFQTNHMHMTPLPSKMKFFDIDNDGVVNLFEFARALGHNPRKQHVVRAFKAADLDGKICLYLLL